MREYKRSDCIMSKYNTSKYRMRECIMSACRTTQCLWLVMPFMILLCVLLLAGCTDKASGKLPRASGSGTQATTTRDGAQATATRENGQAVAPSTDADVAPAPGTSTAPTPGTNAASASDTNVDASRDAGTSAGVGTGTLPGASAGASAGVGTGALPGATTGTSAGVASGAMSEANATAPSEADTAASHGTQKLAALGDIIEIREKMFVAQSNDIYYNAPDYLGKTLKYEGIFTEYEDPDTGEVYYSVIRYGPGCCGIDANCGFEVRWENSDAVYPQENDWVEAVGVLEAYEEDGFKYLLLNLISLQVLDVRGNENVTQ